MWAVSASSGIVGHVDAIQALSSLEIGHLRRAFAHEFRGYIVDFSNDRILIDQQHGHRCSVEYSLEVFLLFSCFFLGFFAVGDVSHYVGHEQRFALFVTDKENVLNSRSDPAIG